MRLFIAALLLFLPGLSSAQECTCNAVTSDPVDWARTKYQGSTYVFFGRVISVAPPLLDANEVHDQPTVAVLHDYKGHFPGGEVRGAECGSAILPGESAVFFLDGYGRIKSCSIGVSGLTEREIQKVVLEVSRHGT
ncbi:hypothetical protein J2X06_001102 [Lysobacter niastensis]|uniref:Uncharacterized protein n=1 Tax=Lysobacter niastensis TaxID=380629 RepID=A0ABU1W8J7_9GAMM|nr:hypothetical protein [Lysobacter niastensis]MDR7133918.1 hypothetical protein [Lysobacter niastensis]